MSTRIAYDHQAFVMQAYGGISRYYTRLVMALAKGNSVPHIFAPFHKNVYLSELSNDLVSGKYCKKFPPKTASFVNLYNRSKLDKSISKFKPDILHETYYSTNKKYASNKKKHTNLPVITTVYDMIHELLPESFSAHDTTARQKREAVMQADHIICISESTRKDLVDICNIPENKTSVVHLASDISLSPSFQLSSTLVDKPFIFFVGQRGGYKNFNNFIRSIALSEKLKNNFNIICFGGGGFSDEEEKNILALGFNQGQVKQVSGDDSFLSALYSQARVFVCPSQYEGFGLPIIEAISMNCPVICSHLSSLPEVGGDAAEYFDPYSIEEMSSVIEEVAFSDSTVDTLRNKGKERENVFSWDRCAEETLTIYSHFV